MSVELGMQAYDRAQVTHRVRPYKRPERQRWSDRPNRTGIQFHAEADRVNLMRTVELRRDIPPLLPLPMLQLSRRTWPPSRNGLSQRITGQPPHRYGCDPTLTSVSSPAVS